MTEREGDGNDRGSLGAQILDATKDLVASIVGGQVQTTEDEERAIGAAEALVALRVCTCAQFVLHQPVLNSGWAGTEATLDMVTKAMSSGDYAEVLDWAFKNPRRVEALVMFLLTVLTATDSVVKERLLQVASRRRVGTDDLFDDMVARWTLATE